eukprot:559679-Pyramimonas_sp.AAC.1
MGGWGGWFTSLVFTEEHQHVADSGSDVGIQSTWQEVVGTQRREHLPGAVAAPGDGARGANAVAHAVVRGEGALALLVKGARPHRGLAGVVARVEALDPGHHVVQHLRERSIPQGYGGWIQGYGGWIHGYEG